jgi:hypothetical protein
VLVVAAAIPGLNRKFAEGHVTKEGHHRYQMEGKVEHIMHKLRFPGPA